MSMFKVDGQREMVREGGAFVRTSGVDEVRQDAEVSPLIFRGEIPWNLRDGSRLLDLLGRTPPEILAAYLRGYIGARPSITDILSLEVVDEGNRRVSVPWRGRVSLDDLKQSVLVEDTLSLQTPG
jgi:hypothetical protein